MDPERAEEASNAAVDDICFDVIAQKAPLDFDSWVSVISHVEKLYYDDEDKISYVYDSFLSEFPLCYGYWRKYAAHMIRLSTSDKIIQVFEQAVLAVTHSVGIWLDYCVCCMSLFPDPNDVRRQFKRGLSHVGRDYLCYTLWDKYIEFEFSQQNWSALAYIYIQILRHPKKMLGDYYNRFTQLVTMFKEEMERQGTFAAEIDLLLDYELAVAYTDDEILAIIKDLLDDSDSLSKTKAWQKYKFIGESLHGNSCLLDENIRCFEDQIHRTYFHVIPLNKKELENWHHYLDFVEEQGDFDWTVKLYERCLIPCAMYTDFWIRYVQLLENDGGRELANFALDRATKTFLKTVPSIHLFNARYKEKTQDFHGARTSFPKFDREELHPSFISNVMEKANMERRVGDYEAACRIYREAIELTTERKKMNMLSCLYINYSRLTYKATNSVGAALGILADGIKQIPHCKLLLKELIKFGMMHGGPKDINIVDSIVSDALTSKDSLSFRSEEKESMSLFYLKFVDLCGTIDDLMKAWTRHIKLFPYSIRTSFSEEPPNARQSAQAEALRSTKLCTDVDPSTCSPSTLDKPDQVENQTEPGKQHKLEGSECARDVLENGSVPSPNNVVGPSSADYIHDTDTTGNTKDSTKLGDNRHVEDLGDENNLNNLSFRSIVVNDEHKGPPNAITTMDDDCHDLEDVSRDKKEELITTAICDRSLPYSLQDPQLSDPHVGAFSNSGHGVRGNCSNDDQNLLQRSPSPVSTPRSVSSYGPKSSGNLSSALNEISAQSFPETARDWQHGQRPDRFIIDPNSKLKPNRQRRPSPPRNYRSDSDHIITVQRNATQPMPKRTLPAQDNPVNYQQPWSSTPFNAVMGHSWPVQNMQHIIPSASQSQVAFQPVEQASARMLSCAIQAGNQAGQMPNQQAYDQMTQNYYYQQQVLVQQQQPPQQFQLTPEQWQQQQQQYWMQLQYQQQLAQQMPLQMQQQTQVPLQMQQQQTQVPVPLQMQQQAQATLQMQQQDQPGSQAPLLHQQQLQQLLELQQQRKQQQLQHQEPQSQPQQEMPQMQQQQHTPSSSEK